MKWSIRNYNTFLREIRSRHDLTLPQARQAYRYMRDRTGRSLRGVDVKRHPVIAKQEAARAKRRIIETPPPAEPEPALKTETILWRAHDYKKRGKR